MTAPTQMVGLDFVAARATPAVWRGLAPFGRYDATSVPNEYRHRSGFGSLRVVRSTERQGTWVGLLTWPHGGALVVDALEFCSLCMGLMGDERDALVLAIADILAPESGTVESER